MFVGFFTSRVTLQVLGVEDYGLSNVIGGIVGMLGFLNGCAAGATSRFLTFSLGQKKCSEMACSGAIYNYRETFSAAFVVHLAIALLIVVFGETIGLWYFNHKLVIPQGREYAAMWVYQLSVFSVLISFTQVPYGASVIAHEKMDIYAYMGIFDAVMKLINAYLLYISPWDKLIFWASWIFLVNAGVMIFYRVYCVRKFGDQCRLKFVFKRSLYRNLLSYSGWDMVGQFGAVARSQGVNLMLNLFFGPVVNAARAVAATVEGALEGFTGNFLTALRPPIIKKYAAGDVDGMLRMVNGASKFSALLYAALAGPLIICSDRVLRLWLGNPPTDASLFLKIILFNYIFVQINKCLIIAVHAIGDVKRLNILSGSKIFLDLPLMYFLLKIGCPAYSVLLVMLVGAFIVMVLDLIVMKINVSSVRIGMFYWDVVFPVVMILSVPTATTIIVDRWLSCGDFIHLVVVCCCFWILLGPLVYKFGLTSQLRSAVLVEISKRFGSILKIQRRG